MKRCLLPGCGKRAKGKGDYCSDSHRAAAHKLRKRTGGMLPTERRRVVDAAAKRAARAQGVIPSDVRVSFEKGVRVLADGLIELEVCADRLEAIDHAERLLARALPERLRPVEAAG